MEHFESGVGHEFIESADVTSEDHVAEPTSIVPPAGVIPVNDQRSASEIKRMVDKETLDKNPDFQRNEVWDNPQQTRLIDSIIKEMPIPNMCMAYDPKTGKRLVIDGLQRISTVLKFLDEKKSWRLSKLDDVLEEISGKTVAEIQRDKPLFYQRVEDFSFNITMLRCDFNNLKHMDYIYNIFYRINTGGRKLNPQEIRNCIYVGNFNGLLSSLAKDPVVAHLFQAVETDNKRLKWNELILRFFAFYDTYTEYTGKLSEYLNTYMNTNKNLNADTLQSKQNLFEETLRFWDAHKSIFPPPSSKPAFEALMVGLAKNLKVLQNCTLDELKLRAQQFEEKVLKASDSLAKSQEKHPLIDRMGLTIDALK